MPSTPALWVGPLLVVFIAQTTATLLSRIAPTLAPALALHLGWRIEDVGLLSSAIAAGHLLFLFAGMPLLWRAGPVRMLQVGLAVGAVGTLLHALPWGLAALAGSLLIGLALGPQGAAGSDVLRRHAPAGRLNLVFSLMQAGVPVGAVLGGLLLPASLMLLGLPATLAACALLGVATLAAMQRLRAPLDAHRDRAQSIHWRLLASGRNLRRPLRTLVDNTQLRRIAVVGGCLAVSQGVWSTFLVTYLVDRLRYTLAEAGVLFALMQSLSVLGRPFMGWLSDHLRSPEKVLGGLAVASGATSLLLAASSTAWPAWGVALLSAVAGLSISSWNGVQGAQVARFARTEALAESASGSLLLNAGAHIVGPAVFGLLVWWSGGYAAGLCVAAGVTLLALLPLRRIVRA